MASIIYIYVDATGTQDRPTFNTIPAHEGRVYLGTYIYMPITIGDVIYGV